MRPRGAHAARDRGQAGLADCRDQLRRPWRRRRAGARPRLRPARRRAPERLVSDVERAYGRILFTASVAALTGGIVGPHYASSKAGLYGLTHFLASRVAAFSSALMEKWS